jgi:ABC-type uncharacterized transport system ATPase subunit
MTVTTDLLLEATGVAKSYGAVVALRSASLAVRPGEVHALMGANGAGKSTLVKILTGAVRPDGGKIVVRGRERTAHSPAEARKGGVVSVYQEPALIPDLDIRSNLRLTETPVEPFRRWLAELGIDDLDLADLARHIPLATRRIIDLARALAIEPDLLLLDEMTAALPANLTERVLAVVDDHRGADRSVIREFDQLDVLRGEAAEGEDRIGVLLSAGEPTTIPMRLPLRSLNSLTPVSLATLSVMPLQDAADSMSCKGCGPQSLAANSKTPSAAK